MVLRTPTEVGVELYGEAERFSRSNAARKVRAAARELFREDAPGKGGEWKLTSAQVAKIKRRLCS
jgi:hypothetical protein